MYSNNIKKIFTTISIAFLAFVATNVHAQDENPVKSYFGFFGGVSNPMGDFKSTDYYNNKSGFAKRGLTYGLDGAFYFHKNWAIGASFSFQDQGELTPNDAQILANGYNTDFFKDNTEITGVDRYHNIFIMAGPQYSWLYHKFTIDVRLSAGVLKSYSTPTVAVAFDNSTNTDLTLHQLSSTASSLAYGGTVGLRWNIGGAWDIGIKGNYIGTQGIKIDNSNNDGTIGRFVTKTPVTVLQTTFGFTLHL